MHCFPEKAYFKTSARSVVGVSRQMSFINIPHPIRDDVIFTSQAKHLRQGF